MKASRHGLALIVLAVLAAPILAGNADVAVVEVDPAEGGPGDTISIRGVGFGDDPGALCVSIAEPGRTIPLEVLAADRVEVLARIGPVPPEASVGRLTVKLGAGGTIAPPADLVGIELTEPISIWRDLKPVDLPAVQVIPFTLLPAPPPEGVRVLFSESAGDSRLRIESDGAWPAGTRIDLLLHIVPETGLPQLKLRVPGMRVMEDRDGPDVLRLLCELLQRVGEAAGVPVACGLEPLGEDRAALVVGLPGGALESGHLTLVLEAPPIEPPPPALEIKGFSPPAGGPGTVVTIEGRGFSEDLEDYAVAIVQGERSTPLQVIEATPTLLRAVLGPVAESAEPGPIVVALGEGLSGPAVLPDVPDGAGRAWIWSSLNLIDDVASSPDVFTPIAERPGPGTTCFFGGPRGGDRLAVVIEGHGDDTVVSLSARLNANGRDAAIALRELRLGRTESSEQIAALLCDVLSTALPVVAEPLEFCDAQPIGDPADDRTLLSLGAPGLEIEFGHLDVCIAATPIVEVPDVEVEDVFPRSAPTGGRVTIRGKGFGESADDLCVVVLNGGRSIPLQAISASDGEVVAELAAVPPDARPGRIMVARGTGRRGFFEPFFDELVIEEPAWVWTLASRGAAGDGAGAGGVGASDFTPVPSEPSPSVQWFFSGLPVDGKIELYLDGDWLGGSRLDIQARVHNPETGQGHDMRAPSVLLPGRGSTFGCALRVCDVVESAFLQGGGIEVECVAEEISLETAKITLGLPRGTPVIWGNLNVCVRIGDTPEDGSLPGDCNTDGALDISDSLCELGYLFLGSPVELPCGEPGGVEPDDGDVLLLDWNADNSLDISDPIGLLSWLFLGGPPHELGEECRLVPTCEKICGF